MLSHVTEKESTKRNVILTFHRHINIIKQAKSLWLAKLGQSVMNNVLWFENFQQLKNGIFVSLSIILRLSIGVGSHFREAAWSLIQKEHKISLLYVLYDHISKNIFFPPLFINHLFYIPITSQISDSTV